MSRTFAMLVCLSVLAVGCGDGDGDQGQDSTDSSSMTTTTAAEPQPLDADPAPVPAFDAPNADASAFCTATLELSAAGASAAILERPSPAMATRLQETLLEVRSTAPAELGPAVEELTTWLVDAGGELAPPADPADTATVSGEVGAAGRVAAWLVDNCGFGQVRITASDGELSGLPATLDSGGLVVTLTNDTDAIQLVVAARLRDGITDEVDELPSADSADLVTKVMMAGTAGASAGQEGLGTFALTTGDYLVWSLDPTTFESTSAPVRLRVT